jgi:hypothetical protein
MADKYEPSFGDIAWGVPGAGEGIEKIYNFLGGPSKEELKDLYGTYGEQGKDREWYEGLKDPAIYGDATKFGVNIVKDLAQFFPDLFLDTAQAGLSQLAQTELYNPFSEEGRKREIDRMGFLPHIPGVDLPGWDVLMEPEWKYKGDALLTDWLGEKLGTDVPTIMKDNPFENAGDNPIMDKINAKAKKEIDDYFFGKNGFMTEKKWDDLEKIADKKLPWAKWQRANPGVSTKEYYRELDDIVSQEWDNRYGDQWADLFEKSTKGQLLGKYNIGGKKTSPLREYEFGFKVPLPFTDKEWDIGYAWEGKPLLHQLGEPFTYAPERRDVIERAHGIADIAAGFGLRKLPSKIMDRLGKRVKPSRRADEGIMRNTERLEDKRFDWAKEWMRTRGG